MLLIQGFNNFVKLKVTSSVTTVPEGRIGRNIDFLSLEKVTAASWVRFGVGETEERKVSRWQHKCI